MKANELRIGNWVNEPMSVDFKIRQENLCDFANGYLILKPIPLTEKWLGRFCLDNNKTIVVGYNGDDFLKNRMTVRILGSAYIHIQYVHQLQNLYFALTGEELQCN